MGNISFIKMVVVTVGIAALLLFGILKITEMYNEIYNFFSTIRLVVNKHNEINHENHLLKAENHLLKAEVEELRKVNKQLIEKCDHDDVIRAIKATPLPKMKGC